MASSSYIQRDAVFSPSSNGKRLMLNINSIRRSKGTQTTDLPFPGKPSEVRQLLPLSGQINDFTINCVLREESSNVGYIVLFAGSTISENIQTITQQYNYLFDALLSSDINTKYKLYVDWLDKTFTGQIFLESTATERDFTGEVEVSITFREGGNFLST
jgi:hypothetical protein